MIREKYKICFAIPSLNIGGSEKILISLASNLSSDFSPLIWAWQGEGLLKKEIEKAKIPYFFFILKKHKFDFFSVFQAAEILKKEKIDIFDSWSYGTPFWDLITAKIAKIPKIIHTRHSLGFWRIKRYFLNAYFERRLVDRFVAISEAIKEDLKKEEKIPDKKIEVIPDFLDLKEIKKQDQEKVKKKWKIKKDEKVIGNISRLDPIKGLKYFLEVAFFVLRRRRRTKFILVGSGKLEKELKDLAKKLKIEKEVIFSGSIINPYEILPCFDILVSSSLSEGFGLNILEAWAYDIPVIFTKCGGPEEIIDDGKNGFLVKKREPNEIAKKILYLLENPFLAKKMGKAGRKKLEEKYSAEKCVKKYEKVYEEM